VRLRRMEDRRLEGSEAGEGRGQKAWIVVQRE
jgi:hypothetical protein